MDYEEAANLTNLGLDKSLTPEESMEYIAHEIIFTLFCVIGMCADAAIIYTIFHFKRMHTVPNMFLANWAIADLCSLMVTPSSYRIISVLENINLSQEFICFLFHTDLIFHSAAMLFMHVIALDWCIGAYFRGVSEKFRNFFKFVIGIMWVFALLLCSISTRLCIKRMYHFIPGFLLLFSYCSLLLFIIVLQSCKAIQKLRKKELNYPTLMLTLATVFVLSWLVGLINFLFFEIGGAGYHWLITMVSQCVIFASSIINFTLLYRLNNDFHACVRQVLKRSESRYEDAISESESPAKNTNVAFQNSPGQELTSTA